MNIRQHLIWFMDSLCGRTIRKHYLDIKYRNNGIIPNVEQLRSILDFAVKNSTFYSTNNPNDIKSFPILTKNDIREYEEQILVRGLDNKDIYETSTSGSTGIPLKIKWNRDKRYRQIAEMLYYYEVAGNPIGEKIVFFRENQDKDANSRFMQFAKNIYDYDVTSVDDIKLEKIIERLKRRPYISCYLAYGSFHELLLNLILRKNIECKFHAKAIISGSEVFNIESKKKLSEITGAKVFDRYSNEENGFIAQTEDCSDIFKVNVASFFVEILKQDSNEPADEGEIGRIVVTDLFNKAMPLVRYDTGDLSVCHKKVDGWVTELEKIYGRQSDVIFNTKGERMTTSVWNAYMGEFMLIKQYQFIQEDEKTYRLKVNGAKGIYSDNELKDAIKKAIGLDAEIIIEHVEGIPQLSSGKFKKTVCNYKPKI